jgi:hypothetical protein
MNNTQNPVARKEGLVIQEMPDELLVYDMESNKAHCLNSTATAVWKACDGQNDISDIAGMINKTDKLIGEELVWLAIKQLNESNLLEQKISSKFEGISRREVIKKVGLTAAISLPIISALSFPSATLASTCNASDLGGTCTIAVGTPPILGNCCNIGGVPTCQIPACFIGTKPTSKTKSGKW